MIEHSAAEQAAYIFQPAARNQNDGGFVSLRGAKFLRRSVSRDRARLCEYTRLARQLDLPLEDFGVAHADELAASLGRLSPRWRERP